MHQFREDRPVMGIGRGRGRGRGRARDPVNPNEEDGGQGRDPVQAVIRGRGRAAPRPRAISPEQVVIPNKAAPDKESSSSYSESLDYSSTTWEKLDDIPKERMFLVGFADVDGAKSGGFGMGTKKNEDTEKPNAAEGEEEKREYPPPGFLDPMNISLPYLSDTIKPGDELYCAVYTMESTSNVYLIFSQHFSKVVDSYINGIGRWYWNEVQRTKLLKLNVRDEGLVAGAIVVVYDKTLREWKRAKIVEPFKRAQGQRYRVLFLDLGDYEDVHSLDIVYMHEIFKEKPVFAIKARIQLSPFYNCVTYRYNDKWDKKVCEGILDSVRNKRVLVKFIAQEEFEGEKCWIVSLLSMVDRPGFQESCGSSYQNLNEDQPIEQKVIAKMNGEYIQ